MKSPFPGMDPFLEEPHIWSSVHHRLITLMSDAIAEQVAPSFYVDIEERVYIVTPEDIQQQFIVPDVYLVSGRSAHLMQVAANTITTPTLIEPLYEPEIHERFLSICDKRTREVVTMIELLPPANKAASTMQAGAFEQKRKTVMTSETHWIEIDLLRAGERPFPFANNSDYYALLKRGGFQLQHEAWFFNLRDSLPTIAVPLRSPFPDVPLNLQAVFNTMYERAHYADSVDYQRSIPAPRLRPADELWVLHQVQQWNAVHQPRSS